MTAIGLDLAWKETGDTGLFIYSDHKIVFWDVDSWSNLELLEIIGPYLDEHTTIAIDAPLVVPNQAGIRSCELAFKRLDIAGHKLSILGSNRNFLIKHFGSIRGADLSLLITNSVQTNRRQPQIIETFPTASVTSIFSKRIPYKFSAGKTKQGVVYGMAELATGFSRHKWFSQYPEIEFQLNLIGAHMTRNELKRKEDLLDALICGYTAWQKAQNSPDCHVVHGSQNDGEIVFSLT